MNESQILNLEKVKIKNKEKIDGFSKFYLFKDRFFSFFITLLFLMYVIFLLGDFLGPYGSGWLDQELKNLPPDKINFNKIIFFTKGPDYKLFGFMKVDKHLFGCEDKVFLFGTDYLGRDIFSLILSAGFTAFNMAFIAALISGLFSWYAVILLNRIVKWRMINKLFKIYEPIPGFIIFLILLFIFKLFLPFGLDFWTFTGLFIIYGTFKNLKFMTYKINELYNRGFVKFAEFNGADRQYIFNSHVKIFLHRYLFSNFLTFASLVIMYEFILSFLGIGLNNALMSWGQILKESFAHGLFRPWQAIICSAFILMSWYLFAEISKKIVNSRTGLDNE